ncbi:MAG TPA: hypothetical protein VH572_04615 [Gaiella sp.]
MTPERDPSRTQRQGAAVRLGVVLCVIAALVLVALRLDDVLGLFDFRADRNAALGYLERSYGDEGVVGDREVVEEALARMPPDARYRVVFGSSFAGEHRFTRALAADFLRYHLLPRRRTDSPSAPWVFCYGCDPTSLPGRVEVLYEGRNGLLLGRTT